MTRLEFKKLIEEGFVILDGATGSLLQKKGMMPGDCPEQWIIDNPEAIIDIQKDYIEAGSNIIYSPTFTGNRIKLAEYGLEDNLKEINTGLVMLSKEAIKRADADHPCFVAGDITMTGEQLYPIGKLMFEELVDIYKEQVSVLYEAGVDLFVVETMMSLQECRAAVLAIKEICELPIMVTLSFGGDGRTLFGTDPVTAVNVLQSMGVDAVGANCSSGADKMMPVIEKMVETAYIPVIAKPNCGMPELVNGETVYTQTPEEFAQGVLDLANIGASILGGCCGTDKNCIRNLKQLLDKIDYKQYLSVLDEKRKRAAGKRLLSSERKTIDISLREKLLIIGERINPTGKKALSEQLRQGSMDLVTQMAEEQEEYGADILDVNVGTNGLDEKEVLFNAVNTLTQIVDLPLSIDTSNIDAMEHALRHYPGRALMNSISLDEEKIDKLLPLAKKYGAMFVLLPLSEKGLPKDLNEKIDIINTIVDRAREYGITKDSIVVDGLVATVGANKFAAIETVQTIDYCTNTLGVETVCGLSNISFGLPERQYINAAFVTQAITAGLTMAIANPMQELLMNAIYSTDLLLARKDADLRYVERITVFNKEHVKEVTTVNVTGGDKTAQKSASTGLAGEADDKNLIDKVLYETVVKGRKEQAFKRAKELLDEGISPEEIINRALIPGINEVGKLYENGRYFLPQLMNSAETMKHVIDYLEPLMDTDKAGDSKGIVVIATVKGDIHDIGKNLVAIMLKNCGFEVHDLGKNVEADDIITAAIDYKADIIGLSALMTTTMMEMKNVVDKVREKNVKVKIMIGGAVVTDSFAKEIGADAYSEDAGEAVKVAEKLMETH